MSLASEMRIAEIFVPGAPAENPLNSSELKRVRPCINNSDGGKPALSRSLYAATTRSTKDLASISDRWNCFVLGLYQLPGVPRNTRPSPLSRNICAPQQAFRPLSVLSGNNLNTKPI